MRADWTTRRRYVLALGSLGATGLAGCSGNGDGEDGEGSTPDGGGTTPKATGGPTTSNNTTAGPSGTESTTGPAALDPPPGTSADGVEDQDVLVGATETALTEADYDLTQQHTSTGSGGVDVRQHTLSSLDEERQLFVFESAGETNRVYVEDGVRYGKFTSDGETSYGSGEARQSFEELHAPSQLAGPESLGGILEFGSFTPAETVTRNGRRLVRFTVESASFGNDSYEVTESEGELFVSAGSVVFGGALSLTAESDEETVTLDKGFGIEQLGDVTVERPEWFDRVPTPTPTPTRGDGGE